MRSVREIHDSSRPGAAFSNSTSWDMWSARWCEGCHNDINEDCPIILTAMFGDRTPQEWVEVGMQNYECTEFQPREENQ